MPKQERPDTHSDIDEVSVHLKPILGVRPGTYLTMLYGLVLLIVVFFLLFSPGLRHRGSYLTASTFPDHATVKVDGVYAGSTPCTIFLKKGDRTLDISKPFYSAVSLRQTVRGRVFGTLFVKDRTSISRTLAIADLSGLLQWALSDFQKNPQIPQIVSNASYAAFGSGEQQQFYDFISNSLLFVTDESQLRELLLAAARISTHGTALTAGSFISLLQHSIQIAQKYDNFPAWLLLALSRTNQAKLMATPWVQSYMTSYKNAIAKYYQPGGSIAGAGGNVTIAGMAFRSIPSGDLVMGKDDNLESLGKSIDRLLPHPIHIDSFYLGTMEVTNARFQSFVNENPDWAPSSRTALMAKGLVTDAYLSDWKDDRMPSGSENLPVTSLSWHAAAAFCAWLTRSVQAALPGYIARLPMEAEWEWAARGGLRGMPYPLGGKPGGAVFYQKGISKPFAAGTSEPNGYGLSDMLGNVWEWCVDPFSFNTGVLSSLNPRTNALLERSLPGAPDRAVRGGSWADQSGADKVYTRGSQPSEWCTPYLGFRVALARQ
ncbi:MAG: SUMF1/EgtB/PvdO family nonheme iron enzyme [Spirochaetia bacterium]|jgi:formylglycine-generating enzyme required for sulfatase activity